MSNHHTVTVAAALLGLSLLPACHRSRTKVALPRATHFAQGAAVRSGPARLVTVVESGVAPFYKLRTDRSGPAVRLTPLRAEAYGVRAADVRLQAVSPNQETLVVRAGGGLFAVPTDGSRADNPLKIAGDVVYCSDVVFSRDGTWVAWIDRVGIRATPIDGSRAAATAVVARSTTRWRAERPRWLYDGSGVAFVARVQGGSGARTFAAARDGSEADAPRDLTKNPTGQHLVQDAIDSGLLVLLDKGHLHVLSPRDGRRVAQLSSELTSVAHVWPDGRVLLDLDGTSFSTPSKLAVVSLTGGRVVRKDLTGYEVYNGAVVDAEGRGLAYVGKVSGGWAVFYMSSVDHKPRRISSATAEPPALIAFKASSSSTPWIHAIGNRGHDAHLSYSLSGSASTAPRRVRVKQRAIADDGVHGVKLAFDESGRARGELFPLTAARVHGEVRWSSQLSAEIAGALVVRDLPNSALAVSTPGKGAPRLLSPWIRGVISHARLRDGEVVFWAQGPRAWYSAPLAPGRKVRRISPVGFAGQLIGVGRSSILVARSDSQPGFYAVAGSRVAALPGVTNPLLWLADRRALVFARAKDLVLAQENKGTKWDETKLLSNAGSVTQLVYDSRSRRVVAAVQEALEVALYSVPLNSPKDTVEIARLPLGPKRIARLCVDGARVIAELHEQRPSFTARMAPPIVSHMSWKIDRADAGTPWTPPVADAPLEPCDPRRPVTMGPESFTGWQALSTDDGQASFEIKEGTLRWSPTGASVDPVDMSDASLHLSAIVAATADWLVVYGQPAARDTNHMPDGHAYGDMYWLPATPKGAPHALSPLSKYRTISVVGTATAK